LDSEKITVDEPLISTDVDNLIRTIADRKKVPLNELRRVCKIDKKNMDKWIAVLEDEGYINVEYALGSTNIIWKGLQESPAEESYASEGLPESKTPDESYEEDGVAEEEAEEKPEEAKEKFSDELPLEESNDEEVFVKFGPGEDPEELLSKYLEKKKDKSKAGTKDLKSSILTSLGEEDAAPQPPEEPKEEEIEPEPLEEEPEDSKKEVVYGESEVLRPTEKEDDAERRMSADVRELMTAYLEEINKEKVSIEKLKKERECLYREKFATLEGKMQADIVAFTEKILEKQEKLSQIRESVLELPDKVEEVERLHKQMEELKKEGRAALERTREKAEEYVGSISQSKEEIKSRIDELNTEMEQQSQRVEALEKARESMDERSQKLTDAIETTKAKVDEINSVMSGLMDDLQEVERIKSDMTNRKEEIKETVATHGEELSSLLTELEGVSRLEQWVQEYVRDYQDKIESIDDYVSRGETELMDLKEAAESLYMKKYISELESMTEAYGNELDDAVRKEKKIEQKMMESRSRITELARESQDMVKALQDDVSETKDFDKMLKRVRERTAKTKKMVEEKEKERSELEEEVAKTRKSKRSAALKAKVGEPPKPKKRKKKPYSPRKKKK
jgi:methyl-accepting chemotaxis protein